ncbi:extracellular catalytic domain type 1 short-chain-length polyhydroxyalkanoate depolymerase [Bradyrhizobium liaoningense]|uniref:extracellular catalytic domain type 1 short-chain-length polyhydroxyalkanoate depolymerase n=1 Tax=Bradyrhizobium liaoningense TaxID=43992 RepID=UPI001BA86CE0|nr:PHB depolymerase family esterase [Bradyrhizobium liaoningense]MBR1169661.1 PHB depolymerase family esterase [Bradyrhizobium liaoningense]
MLNQDIIREATRLTRSGQLVEATALLQRMLRGEKEPGATAPTVDHAALASGREPPTIDAKANAAETRRPRRAAQPAVDIAKNLSGLGLGGALRRAPPPMADIVPDGVKFVEGVYANGAGSRAYRLFIPSGYHGQPIPLVIMLHGCTQSPEDFAAGTRMNFIAEEQTCFVAYPAQRADANQAKCWNWFRPADQQRDGGEPSLIAGITRQIMCDYSVDSERVYVAGLSAGAAAAAVMGSTYGDLYAAIGIHSGLACGAASDLSSALIAMKQGGGSDEGPEDGPSIPTIVFHGDRDNTVHSKNGARIVRQSVGGTSTTTKVHRGRVPGGHAYTRTVHTDVSGRSILEHWEIHGAGHAWSGGSPAGSYTDPDGPDATREMLRFFLEHSLPQGRN